MRRNAHPEYIASLLEKNIPEGTRLVLNADDIISSSIAPKNKRVYFGIEPLPDEPPARGNIVIDARLCPACGAKLEYLFRRYNHIARPLPRLRAEISRTGLTGWFRLTAKAER